MIRGLVIALCASLFACLWLYFSLDNEREAHNATRADNVRLMAAFASHERAIARLHGDLAQQARLIAERDANVATFNSSALDAAIIIEGAANDSPMCNIDVALPDTLSRPLLLLHAKASGRDGYSGNPCAAPLPPVSAQAPAGAAANNDAAQPCAVDGKAAPLGKRND
jgi:hypothetical protein